MKEKQDAIAIPGKSQLRYPLRSAIKSKEEKPSVAELSIASNSRGRPALTVSKSTSGLHISGEERSAKPPRRLSIPAKSTISPVPKPFNITTVSETRLKRSVSVNGQGKTKPPVSVVPRTSGRKKFSALSSVSYWLSQIRLSESASKHSISLGFFKLAFEVGCEPLGRMIDELKLYLKRHKLGEMEETVKCLLQIYGIADNQERVQVSETCSQVPGEGTRSNDDEVPSISSTVSNGKLKPMPLNGNAAATSTLKEPIKKEGSQTRKNSILTRTRSSLNNTSDSKSVTEFGFGKLQKRTEKSATKLEASKEKRKVVKQGKKTAIVNGAASSREAAVSHEDHLDKENVDGSPAESVRQNAAAAVKTLKVSIARIYD